LQLADPLPGLPAESCGTRVDCGVTGNSANERNILVTQPSKKSSTASIVIAVLCIVIVAGFIILNLRRAIATRD